MMLGINAPKPLVKGEFAKAVRKAVHDSMVADDSAVSVPHVAL
ncbi:hypothetical protein [Segatella hominis]